MRIEDEPLEDFYPVCAKCGEKITGAGHEFDGEYYCDDCFTVEDFDGRDIAEEQRDAAFEDARERFS